MRGRAAAAFVVVAVFASLYSITWRPLSTHAAAAQGSILTNAGSAGSGTAISLGQEPYAFAVAGTHLYIGDRSNPVLRDLDTVSGQETILAGNGGYGYKGDGGPATSAMIAGAWAMARCGTDTYFADTSNYVIRKIDNAGNITTVVGTGRRGYSDGPGISAGIGRVFGMACMPGGVGPDAPFLYFSDADNGVLRGLTGTGLVYSLLGGLNYPTGVLFDPAANLYLADSGTHMVWRGDGITRVISAFAGNSTGLAGFSGDGGQASSAQLSGPWGLAYTPVGGVGCGCVITIADRGNNRVRAVDANGVITTLAGTGTAGFSGDAGNASLAKLDAPAGLGYDVTSKVVYVGDSGNYRARKIDMTSKVITTVAGNGTPSWSGDTGQANAAQLGNPYAVAFDGAGNEYIADNQNNVIRKVTPAGVISTVAGSAALKPGFSGDTGAATSAQLNDPRGIAVTPAGDIAISDTGNQRIRWVTAAGTISTIAGNGTPGTSADGAAAIGSMVNYPTGLAIDAAGKVYIADSGNHRVRVVDRGLNTITGYAGTGQPAFGGDGLSALTAWLNNPRGLAFDGAGNLYISDANNHRVRKVTTATGVISTVAGNGTPGMAGDSNVATAAALTRPFGLAIDTPGNLYIAEPSNHRIRMVNSAGIISSVVATCGISNGFSGDGGVASIAKLNLPFGLAINSSGDLFIADVNNNRVRAAYGLATGRPALCPSPTVGGPTAHDTAQSPSVGPSTGPRLPQFDKPETLQSSAAPTTPVLMGSAWTQAAPARPAAAQPAALPPAPAPQPAAAPAAALPAAAAQAAAPPAVAPAVESAPAISSREVAVIEGSRSAAVSTNGSAPAVPPAALIPLAAIALALLLIRRRKNRRLLGHTRP